MKFVIDSSIPFINGVFEPFAEVVYLDGAEIGCDDVRDADCLIIRTRTKCNESLLEGSKVKMIATATAGMEQIDIPWCKNRGIVVRNSPGCNAGGVMNYVFSALYGTASRKSIPLNGLTFGVIGCGNVGSRVSQMAMLLGFDVLICDPYRERDEGGAVFCSMDHLLANSDIVSLHIPLNEETKGLADAYFFSKMRYGAFFINAAHGDIVIEDDLINAIPKLGPVILDTWSHEPDINTTLLSLVDIGTAHISGYSYQSKVTSTKDVVRQVARYFSISELYDFFPATDKNLEAVKIPIRDLDQGGRTSIIQYNYPVFTDDFMLRMNPEGFNELRNNYQYRREFYTE